MQSREVNHGGLAQLYEILLDSATEQITAALRLVLKAAEADRTALLFCKVRKTEFACTWQPCFIISMLNLWIVMTACSRPRALCVLHTTRRTFTRVLIADISCRSGRIARA